MWNTFDNVYSLVCTNKDECLNLIHYVVLLFHIQMIPTQILYRFAGISPHLHSQHHLVTLTHVISLLRRRVTDPFIHSLLASLFLFTTLHHSTISVLTIDTILQYQYKPLILYYNISIYH